MTEKNYTYITSIDIGYKNFAFCVEKVSIDILHIIKNISKIKRYCEQGYPTKEFQKILNEVYLSGELVLEKNIDLTLNLEHKDDFNEICISMTNTLDEYKFFFDKCDSIVIEQQMSFGKNKNNIKALKLGQHCKSYFLFNYSRYKVVVDFPAYHKTKVLGAGKKLTKPERKKWSSDIYLEILELRKDIQSLENHNKRKKKDDVADTCTQLQAFKYLVYVEKSL